MLFSWSDFFSRSSLGSAWEIVAAASFRLCVLISVPSILYLYWFGIKEEKLSSWKFCKTCLVCFCQYPILGLVGRWERPSRSHLLRTTEGECECDIHQIRFLWPWGDPEVYIKIILRAWNILSESFIDASFFSDYCISNAWIHLSVAAISCHRCWRWVLEMTWNEGRTEEQQVVAHEVKEVLYLGYDKSKVIK